MSNVPPGDHAPIPGDDHQEVRIRNDYGQSPVVDVSRWLASCAEYAQQIANLVQSNLVQPERAEQVYTEMMSAATQAASYGSMLQPGAGPPQQNQFATHGYSEDNILDQQNKPVLFWDGPRHQQFHVVTELDARLVVQDSRVMSMRHEERTRGLRYSYRLRSFHVGNTSFGVYVLDSSTVNCGEVVQFFQSLAGVVNEYEFIAHSRTFNLEQRARFHSIAEIRRSVREEVYMEVLVRVRQEFAERERNRPPASPCVLQAIDTDEGRSIKL